MVERRQNFNFVGGHFFAENEEIVLILEEELVYGIEC